MELAPLVHPAPIPQSQEVRLVPPVPPATPTPSYYPTVPQPTIPWYSVHAIADILATDSPAPSVPLESTLPTLPRVPIVLQVPSRLHRVNPFVAHAPLAFTQCIPVVLTAALAPPVVYPRLP